MMDVQNTATIITTVAVALIGIAVPYITKFVKSNKTAQTLVDILPVLAKDAVVAMEKLGVVTYIDGKIKKTKAGQIVTTSLSNLGFDHVDEATITNAVESAYATLQTTGVLNPYLPQAANSEDSKCQTELKAAKQEITNLKQQLATANVSNTASSVQDTQPTIPLPTSEGDSNA